MTLTEGGLLIICFLLGAILKCVSDIRTHLKKSPTFDPNAPCNVYGEGLVDGIQNAIERGQRGISTYR